MSLLLNTLANVTPVLAQTAYAVVETAKAAAPAPAANPQATNGQQPAPAQ